MSRLRYSRLTFLSLSFLFLFPDYPSSWQSFLLLTFLSILAQLGAQKWGKSESERKRVKIGLTKAVSLLRGSHNSTKKHDVNSQTWKRLNLQGSARRLWTHSREVALPCGWSFPSVAKLPRLEVQRYFIHRYQAETLQFFRDLAYKFHRMRPEPSETSGLTFAGFSSKAPTLGQTAIKPDTEGSVMNTNLVKREWTSEVSIPEVEAMDPDQGMTASDQMDIGGMPNPEKTEDEIEENWVRTVLFKGLDDSDEEEGGGEQQVASNPREDQEVGPSLGNALSLDMDELFSGPLTDCESDSFHEHESTGGDLTDTQQNNMDTSSPEPPWSAARHSPITTTSSVHVSNISLPEPQEPCTAEGGQVLTPRPDVRGRRSHATSFGVPSTTSANTQLPSSAVSNLNCRSSGGRLERRPETKIYDRMFVALDFLAETCAIDKDLLEQMTNVVSYRPQLQMYTMEKYKWISARRGYMLSGRGKGLKVETQEAKRGSNLIKSIARSDTEQTAQCVIENCESVATEWVSNGKVRPKTPYCYDCKKKRYANMAKSRANREQNRSNPGGSRDDSREGNMA
ncbi:hypothetical protein BCR39DRAFT_503287 [Naematelia encephala]|uniref:Uncharacterized protein n=1 Tax=Naematelia encephala TaxID=71784 RepID=A0A1Y2BJL4_9TREE|nr:hypothetical protein BCR39DRAFT_503287 [Naematelia encephala]